MAPDVWLAFARCARDTSRIAPEHRWAADREAADGAVATVLETSGLARAACVLSRSHSRGLAAAVAAPAGVAVGVDLIGLSRVGRRHADAILTGEEWGALAPWAAVRPALAWAIKEAAAKASGDPGRFFPEGLRIKAAGAWVGVEVLGSGSPTFTTGWGLLDGFLYAWVRGGGGLVEGPSRAARSAGRRCR